MSLVLDGSATLAWCFEDETTSAIEALMLRVAHDGAIVPTIWRLEVANAMRSAIRRNRMTEAKRDAQLQTLGQLAIAIDPETNRHAWSTTVRLSDRFGLTVYDASYLELAQRLGLPLASLDAELRNAAQTSGIALLGT